MNLIGRGCPKGSLFHLKDLDFRPTLMDGYFFYSVGTNYSLFAFQSSHTVEIGTENEYHIGPMADDFSRIFNTGDSSGIAAKDNSGIALIGIQQLLKRMMN